MAHRDTTDRIDEHGLIAGLALGMLLVVSLIAVATIYIGGY